ncbi:hypothetical protein MMC25_005995 [Agyrium rufum]|nr:hypothetical protein [Agyrium rufum]
MDTPTDPRAPPHIRLNSGTSDILARSASNRSQAPPGPNRQTSSRSLTAGKTTPTPITIRDRPPPGLYNQGVQKSAERLLSPKPRRYRDDDSPARFSPVQSEFGSRRSSWSSDGGTSRDSRYYGVDSRAPSRDGSDDNDVNTQTVSEKYNILPSAGLLLFPEDVEKDDYLHNPDPNERDIRECDIFTRRGMVNVGGLIFISLGVLMLFVGYPMLTFFDKVTHPVDPCADNPLCINVGKLPLFSNIRSSLIDPDTPDSAKTKKSVDGKNLQLVFSDEFNTDGRVFYEGDDPYFQAVDLWYGVTQDLEWYDPDAITTKDGVLEIRFDAFQNHNLNYRSGMLQSWNQMCFQGGHLEASISLPGAGDTIGFWPGFWAMGNLGRPGHPASTDGMWPYSYDDICDAGITKNQSQTDGLSLLPGMRLPACSCVGEDHPTPGISRSAPEIDVIEGSVGPLNLDNTLQVGVASQSAQMAPFDIWYQPDYDFIELYDPSITLMNAYRGGPYQQALSGVSNLNNDWYNGKAYQTYGFEYTPGSKGKINWFVGEEKTWMMDARSVRPNGNIGQRIIPMEPMALVLNFGMSGSFALLNFTGLAKQMPATMRFDYVRIYQDEDSVSVSCDPQGYETTDYIANHPSAYQNANLTLWDDTPYSWPKNALVDSCTAADTKVPVVRPA